MTGLRAKQRAKRNHRIVEAASTLFRQRGFTQARIDQIAEMAEVSAGTIYNYYENKGDLLLAIVVMEVGVQIEGGRALAKNPPPNVRQALHELMLVMLDNCTNYVNKEMWRHAMAKATQSPNTPFGITYNELDKSLSDNACSLMHFLQKEGHIRSDIDARAAGELWFNSLNMMFTTFVKRDNLLLDDLKAKITRQSEPLVFAIETVQKTRRG